MNEVVLIVALILFGVLVDRGDAVGHIHCLLVGIYHVGVGLRHIEVDGVDCVSIQLASPA